MNYKWWFCICRFKFLTCEKVLWQITHLYWWAPECITFWCCFKVVFLPNEASHWSHLKGLTPLWVTIWFLSVEWSLKRFPHLSQGNGFSPVCVRRCWFRLDELLKVLWQNLHVNGLKPVCVLMCFLISAGEYATWSHSLQACFFSNFFFPFTVCFRFLTGVFSSFLKLAALMFAMVPVVFTSTQD